MQHTPEQLAKVTEMKAKGWTALSDGIKGWYWVRHPDAQEMDCISKFVVANAPDNPLALGFVFGWATDTAALAAVWDVLHPNIEQPLGGTTDAHP